MGTSARRRVFRTAVAALAVAALVVGAAALSAASSTPRPALPPIGARALLASVVRAARSDPSLAGTAASHVDLGIPDLSGVPGAPVDLLSSVNGDHRFRVWRSPDGFRAAELLLAAERSVIVNRREAWTWDSSTFEATHVVFPSGSEDGTGDDEPAVARLDPVELAGKALDAVDPSTRVSVADTAMVASRPTYVLRLEPRTVETLVGRVDVAVDYERRVPLRVAVFARGASSPALSFGYTSIDLGPVDPSTFTFSPPAGAKVTTPRELRSRSTHETAGHRELKRSATRPRTFGTGWATVVALRTPPASELGRSLPVELRQLLPFGGPLFSVRLVERSDHAWLVYGAVPQRALARVEPELP